MNNQESATAAPTKRSRESDDDGEPEMPPADLDDSSDEEIGPMPVPGVEVKALNGRRKRRAGQTISHERYYLSDFEAVLPHERLYLDHLPDTNRYHKSFMHRDAVNFVAVTRYGNLASCDFG